MYTQLFFTRKVCGPPLLCFDAWVRNAIQHIGYQVSNNDGNGEDDTRCLNHGVVTIVYCLKTDLPDTGNVEDVFDEEYTAETLKVVREAKVEAKQLRHIVEVLLIPGQV